MPAHLIVDNVYKNFMLDEKEIVVLDGLDFSLECGDFLTILGPSGCGKSTLIRCICSFESVNRGNILLDGQPIGKPGIDRIMVFQDFNQLFAWKSVLDNVVYPLKLNHIGKNHEDRVRIAEKYLDMVHLRDFLNAFPNQLSGGMRQRVAIARALAMEPKVLLMDEPFGALDAQTRTILQKELLQIWGKTGSTIIFITHNIQEAIILGNKIIVLSQLPARIKLLEENPMGIPRMPETPPFVKLWKKLYANLDVKRF